MSYTPVDEDLDTHLIAVTEYVMKDRALKAYSRDNPAHFMRIIERVIEFYARESHKGTDTPPAITESGEQKLRGMIAKVNRLKDYQTTPENVVMVTVEDIIEIVHEIVPYTMQKLDDMYNQHCLKSTEDSNLHESVGIKGTERTYDWPKPIMRKGTGEGETLDEDKLRLMFADSLYSGKSLEEITNGIPGKYLKLMDAMIGSAIPKILQDREQYAIKEKISILTSLPDTEAEEFVRVEYIMYLVGELEKQLTNKDSPS